MEQEEVKKNENDEQESDTQVPQHPKETDRYYVKPYTVIPGDTVLSIVEEFNEEQSSVQMNQIIQDFQILNPDVDPHQIKPNMDYLFPVYKNLP
ncbi:hypothetical protein GH741_10465 [Aquibacillus halophilus]|uniref:LysM domain-containing protein n=1 Tax=Aquibacillus halophilus TaxID=930132 RepID=A0A6A8DBU8_9BACI|nr:LysM domain-containing protein [Aquibacillus halophilus]MRH43108.1 hypothetical protein [Aquibacillus halophilus]